MIFFFFDVTDNDSVAQKGRCTLNSYSKGNFLTVGVKSTPTFLCDRICHYHRLCSLKNRNSYVLPYTPYPSSNDNWLMWTKSRKSYTPSKLKSEIQNDSLKNRFANLAIIFWRLFDKVWWWWLHNMFALSIEAFPWLQASHNIYDTQKQNTRDSPWRFLSFFRPLL